MWYVSSRLSAVPQGFNRTLPAALAYALLVATIPAQPTGLQPGQKIWEFQTSGPVSAAAVATDGTVYFGSADKKVYALEGKTGSKKWEFQADAAMIVGSPAKVVRELTPEQIEGLRQSARSYLQNARRFKTGLKKIA